MSETSEKRLVSRDDFQKLRQIRYDEEEIPGFGWIRFKNLSDQETRKIMTPFYRGDVESVFADRCIAQLVDDDNDPMFGEMDREWLNGLDFAVSRKIFKVLEHHNDENHSLDELKKTSETTPSSN